MPDCRQCKSSFKVAAPRFYQQLELPEPTLCPVCRRKKRLAFWPYGIWQKRKCDLTGEPIICTYPPNARFPVYKREHWFGDGWNPPEQDIDWGKSFFDQIYELQTKTPHFDKLGKNSTNCDYADDVWNCKNMYMSRSAADDEDLYYSYRNVRSKDCMDITYCYDTEQSYECTYCFNCYNLKFSLDCRECSDSWFLYNCRGCKYCFMSWNLRNREYCIFNKQYTQEEYEEKISSLHLDSRKFLDTLQDKFEEHLKNDAVHKATFNVNTQNCSGNYITNCKNCKNCYFLEESEDCVNVMRGLRDKTSMDTAGLFTGELCYEIVQATDMHNVHFAVYCADCSDSQYLDQCYNCSNCFGCVGLKRKKYCILNKQYSKEEYEKILKKLIGKMKKDGEYGAFFPYKFAYNGYNLSLGAIYYPKSKENIKKLGSFYEPFPEYEKKGTSASELSDLSTAITDDLIGKPFLCVKTGQPFTFIKQELDFYRRYNLPLPNLHPEQRNRRRFGKMAPPIPHKFKCPGCKRELVTYYPEEWGYKRIGCDDCYLKTVY